MQESAELATQWSQVTRHIQDLVTPQQFATWFRSIRVIELSAKRVVLGVSSSFQKAWITNNYQDVIVQALTDATGHQPELAIVVNEVGGPVACQGGAGETSTNADVDAHGVGSPVGSPGGLPTRPPFASGPVAAGPGLESEPARRVSTPAEPGVLLNSAYTFENFIVGPSNRLSHAATMAVADAPGVAYNPFFLTGSVGLGKTHLLQAVCHRILSAKPRARILFLSCETFTNHFIAAVERGCLESFRHRYRNTDVLLIDDVHFLAHKGRTQEEFFHTFNAIFQAGKQIVISSDSRPRDIPSLEERLISRFKSGLVTSIERPDLETRIAIVRSKARIRNRDIPDDVAHYIAERVTTNIRELEGAVVKVIGYAALSEVPLDLALAKDALRDVVCSSPAHVTMSDIIQAVTRHFGIKVSELQSRRRSHSVVFPRQIVMYLARRQTTLSLEEIGGNLGGRDHTTVLYGIDRIKKQLAADPLLRETISHLSDDLIS